MAKPVTISHALLSVLAGWKVARLQKKGNGFFH
jgi:hypothetical protein